MAAVLTECPHADVLVTSRERLRVQGEHVYPVPVLERAESRRLFVARARAAQPGFEPDEHVDDLCARLDDLPLALELAAARTSLLSTEQLLERLGDRLDLLRGGRDAETRQQTLRATIEWSYELLDPGERRLLAALTVFRGGWTLEAAERVADADLELMQSLVDKSLVRRWESGRFGMLETIREFAAEQLEPETRAELVRRLLDHLVEVFEGAHLRPESIALPQTGLAQAERPNIDVALQWATDAGLVEPGLRLLWMLEMYWATNDPLGARERVDALLALAGEDLDPAVHARALRLRGSTLDMTGRSDLSEREYLRARELFRAAHDDEQDRHLTHRIAASAMQTGDFARAERLSREDLEVSRELGDRQGEALALSTLAVSAFARGDRSEALALTYEAADLAQSLGNIWWRSIALGQAAEWMVRLGDGEEARRAYKLSLEGLAVVRDQVNLAIAIAVGAAIAALQEDADGAGTLWGAVEALGEREPKPTTAWALREYAPYVERVRSDEFEQARAYGRTLSLDQAVAYALGP